MLSLEWLSVSRYFVFIDEAQYQNIGKTKVAFVPYFLFNWIDEVNFVIVRGMLSGVIFRFIGQM